MRGFGGGGEGRKKKKMKKKKRFLERSGRMRVLERE